MNGQSRESENEDKNQHQMVYIRAIYRNSGTPVDTSLVWPLFSPTFCGSKPFISSRFIRLAETSIPSFCLSTNGCRCCYNTRSLPQGGILTRLTGSDFLIQCIPAIRHLYRRTLSRIAALEVSGSLCRFRADNICTESCAAIIYSMRQ